MGNLCVQKSPYPPPPEKCSYPDKPKKISYPKSPAKQLFPVKPSSPNAIKTDDVVRMANNAIYGYEYYYHCRLCGKKWTYNTSYEYNDSTQKYNENIIRTNELTRLHFYSNCPKIANILKKRRENYQIRKAEHERKLQAYHQQCQEIRNSEEFLKLQKQYNFRCEEVDRHNVELENNYRRRCTEIDKQNNALYQEYLHYCSTLDI